MEGAADSTGVGHGNLNTLTHARAIYSEQKSRERSGSARVCSGSVGSEYSDGDCNIPLANSNRLATIFVYFFFNATLRFNNKVKMKSRLCNDDTIRDCCNRMFAVFPSLHEPRYNVCSLVGTLCSHFRALGYLLYRLKMGDRVWTTCVGEASVKIQKRFW